MSDERRSTGDVLREYLAERGWTQADLAYAIGKTNAAVNDVIQGKRSVSPEMATLFGAAFGTDASFWLELEAGKHSEDHNVSDTRKRSHFLSLAPIREMARRGWIKDTTSTSDLEAELKTFFRIESLEQSPELSAATRKTDGAEPLSPAQRAWCFRARNLASDLLTVPFDLKRLDECLNQLRPLMAYAPEARKVAEVLGGYGIRLVIVEPLSGSRIDGAAMWIDPEKPMIALSLRMDRIDSFWFTLMHEFSHVCHRDSISVDSDLAEKGGAALTAMKSPTERRADNEAATMLVSEDRITSFIHRVGPLYSKKRIIQFAHRAKVHPGIIVGQLQHRGEIPYSANRELLVKIRDRVVPYSVTDGWGNTVN